MLRKRCAVVDLRCGSGSNRHGTLSYLQRSLAGENVAELVGDIFARGILNDVGIDLGSRAAHIGDGTLVRSRKRITRRQAVGSRTSAGKRSAVVGFRTALRNHHDRSHVLDDLKGTQIILDRVVALLGVVVPIDGVGIDALAHQGLGACSGEGRGFIVHKAGHLTPGGQGTAVVLSLRTVRSHLEGGGRDADGAGALGNLKVVGHIFALRVDDHEVVDFGGHAVCYVGSRCIRGSSLNGIALGQAGNGHVDTVSLTIIGSVVVTGSGNNLVGGLGHRKGAEVLGDGVVALLGRASPVNDIGVGTGADLGLGSRGGEGSGLTVDEARDGALGGERSAVVDLGSAGRSDSQLSRGNLVRTSHVAGVVALAGNDNGNSADIGLVFREGQVVVGALDELRVAILDFGLLRLFGAAVYNVMQIANRHVGSSNALGSNGQSAVVLSMDEVVAFLGSTPFDARDLVGRGSSLGLGAFGLGSRGLVTHEALNGAACGERHAVVDLAVAVGINRERGGRNLVGLGCGASVVALARDGHGDGLGVGEIIRVVGNLVIGAFDQCVALGVFGLRSPLMLLAVINGIGRVAHSDTRIALGVLGVGHDGLFRHLKSAGMLTNNVVIARSAIFELVRDGVFALSNHGLGASRMNLAVVGEVGPDETGVSTVRAHIDPILGKGGAVVDLGSACRGQLNVALINGKGLLGVLVAAVVISRGANLNRHRTSINRRNLGHVAAPSSVGRTLKAVFKAHISAGDRSARACRSSGMRLGVVSVFDIVGHDGQAIICRQRSDREFALVLGDIVVARLEVGTLIVSDGVGNLTLGDCGHGASSADVGDLAVNKTVTSHSDIGPGKRSAIIRLGVSHADEGHRTLSNPVRHIGRTGVVSNAGNNHLDGTNIGGVSFVRERIVGALNENLFAILYYGLLKLWLTVVHNVIQSLDAHILASLDVLSRYAQLAIDDHERDFGEVLVVVGEVAWLELHVVGADVSTLDSIVAAKGEVGFLVQLIRCRECIARDRLLGAIVLKAIAVLGNSDDDLVFISSHNELAILGGNPIVSRIGALVKGVGEGVIAFALLGLGTSNVERDALSVDKANTLTLRSYGNVVVGKRSSVIRLGGARRFQGHKTLGNRNALGSGGVLALCIVGASGAQLHNLVTKVGNRDLGRVARPGLAINAVFDIQGIAILIGRSRSVSGKRSAFIDLLIVVGVPLNTILVDFATLNLEPAVLNHELDVGEVLIGVGELILGKVHIIGTDSVTLGGRGARELNVALNIEAVISREVIAGHGLLGAVVSLGFLLALDGDGNLIGNRVHLQSSVLGLGECVVIRARIGVERVGIGVVRLTNVGDGAGIGIGRTLAFGEALHELHLVLGMLITVVGPLVGSRLHGDGGLGDVERTVLGRDLKLARHVIALGILHHCGASNVIGVGACVGLGGVLGSKARDGIRVALDRELISLDTSCRMLLAIVGSGGGVGFDVNLIFSVTVGGGQRAGGGSYVVVLGLGVVVQFVAESVVA